MMYLIICKDRTEHNKAPVYWKPNSQGYTSNIDDAGRYTKERVDQILRQPYINDYAIEEPEDSSFEPLEQMTTVL